MGATVARATRLGGALRLPGDKSISHRALMLALLANGTSRISGAGDGAGRPIDGGGRRGAWRRGGARGGDAGNVDYVVRSPGANGLRPPGAPSTAATPGRRCGCSRASLPASRSGRSSTAMRPFAAAPWPAIVEPLRAMGARPGGSRRGRRRPLIVGRPRPRCDAIDGRRPCRQRRGEVLRSCWRVLRGRHDDRVRESVATRDHTERMLRARGVAVRSRVATSGRVPAVGRSGVDGASGDRRGQAVDRARPGRPVGRGVLAGRRRDPSRRGAPVARRRRQPDPARRDRPAAPDGRIDRRRRRWQPPRAGLDACKRRADRGPRRSVVRAPGDRARAAERPRPPSTRSRSSASRRRRRGAGP